jgi:putative transcriptional regulator
MERNIFSELMAGFDDLAQMREGKITLRQHEVELAPLVDVSGDELVRIREELHLSRAVFAAYLRMNVRTVENWEQGRAKPNAQATTLIRLVQKFPETIRHLADLSA